MAHQDRAWQRRPPAALPLVRPNYFFFFFAAFFFFAGIGSSPPFRKRDRRRARQRVATWSGNGGGEGAPRPLRRHQRASITYGSALSACDRDCQERASPDAGERGLS